MRELHSTASRGFGRDTEAYVRGRPDFPSAALSWLTRDLGLQPGKVAIELGAGTGKFTRLLVQSGCQVMAVEPVGAMLERLRQDLPGVTALRGTARRIPMADSCADAVICAQSFHWFATAESLSDMRRVLKPGGVLGLIWNLRDPSVDFVARLSRIVEPYEGDAPRYDQGEWRRVFPARGFGELHELVIPHSHVGPAEEVIVQRTASMSFIAALDDKTRAKVLSRVRALIASTPSLANQATVCVPYLTRAYWCVAS
jgi:SAM-dependent methyltransferase